MYAVNNSFHRMPDYLFCAAQFRRGTAVGAACFIGFLLRAVRVAAV